MIANMMNLNQQKESIEALRSDLPLLRSIYPGEILM